MKTCSEVTFEIGDIVLFLHDDCIYVGQIIGIKRESIVNGYSLSRDRRIHEGYTGIQEAVLYHVEFWGGDDFVKIFRQEENLFKDRKSLCDAINLMAENVYSDPEAIREIYGEASI